MPKTNPASGELGLVDGCVGELFAKPLLMAIAAHDPGTIRCPLLSGDTPQPTDEMLATIGGLKHVANIVQVACALSKQCFASADVFFSERSAGEQGACGFCPVVGHGFCPLDFALGDLGVEA